MGQRLRLSMKHGEVGECLSSLLGAGDITPELV